MTTTNGEVHGWPPYPAGRIALLDVDPDLVGDKSGAQFTSARDRLTAPVYRLPVGLMPDPPATKRDGHLGFLVLRGVLLYEVTTCDRSTAELLGPGDLIRPGRRDDSATLASHSTWTVLEQAVLADLGTAASTAWGEAAAIAEALITRCSDRAEAAAIQRSITAHVRVDVRLLAYLWHLADRFGVVCRDGIRIEVPVTHAVLARLVGARRPTVTTALQRLKQLGYLRRDGRAYVLLGDADSVMELERRSPARELALPEHAAVGAA